MFDELRRVAMFTSGVAELTRNQAERLVKDMVQKGDLRRQQASDAVRELVTTSKQSREMLIEFVRGEIRNQIAQLGLASSRDLERLERRIARLEGRSSGTKTASRSASKTGARKSPSASSRKSPKKKAPEGGASASVPPQKVSPSGAPSPASPPGDPGRVEPSSS